MENEKVRRTFAEDSTDAVVSFEEGEVTCWMSFEVSLSGDDT